jgi:hypothetical protein
VEENVWLREKRKKVGVKEFSKLKIIGHGEFFRSVGSRRDSQAGTLTLARFWILQARSASSHSSRRRRPALSTR